jgi:arylformamidase
LENSETLMNAHFYHNGRMFTADFSEPLDISLPVLPALLAEGDAATLNAAAGASRAFYVPEPVYTPFRGGNFVGAVRLGGACNCEEIRFIPHGNGTHTECVGHLTRERMSVHAVLRESMILACVVSVQPELLPSDVQTTDATDTTHATNATHADQRITRSQLQHCLAQVGWRTDDEKHKHGDESNDKRGDKRGDARNQNLPSALVVRTLPNDESKRSRAYSGQNPPYFTPEAASYLADAGVEHVLLDVPSIDREDDGGALLAHRAFWRFPEQGGECGADTRLQATITELVYVPAAVSDGLYLLNLQVASLASDASPSRPVLYRLREGE